MWGTMEVKGKTQSEFTIHCMFLNQTRWYLGNVALLTSAHWNYNFTPLYKSYFPMSLGLNSC
jgi:hypothetical protein